jgi:hypothetical protein
MFYKFHIAQAQPRSMVRAVFVSVAAIEPGFGREQLTVQVSKFLAEVANGAGLRQHTASESEIAVIVVKREAGVVKAGFIELPPAGKKRPAHDGMDTGAAYRFFNVGPPRKCGQNP